MRPPPRPAASPFPRPPPRPRPAASGRTIAPRVRYPVRMRAVRLLLT